MLPWVKRLRKFLKWPKGRRRKLFSSPAKSTVEIAETNTSVFIGSIILPWNIFFSNDERLQLLHGLHIGLIFSLL